MVEFLNIFGHQAYEEDLQVMSAKFDSMQEQWLEIESIAKWLWKLNVKFIGDISILWIIDGTQQLTRKPHLLSSKGSSFAATSSEPAESRR
jgi:hypothetical protein